MTTSDRWAHHPIVDTVDDFHTAYPADVVNHPPHYNSHPSGVECITIAEHMNYCLGNAVKYIWRAGLKGEALEDLRKAQFYIAREIDRIERSVSVTETDGAKNHG